jgi:hypothetical protein
MTTHLVSDRGLLEGAVAGIADIEIRGIRLWSASDR